MPDVGGDRIRLAGRVDEDAALGLVAGNRQERLSQPLVKGPPLPFEAVGARSGAAPPLGGSRQSDLGGYVEDEGQMRAGVADRRPLEGAHHGRIDLPEGALV